MNRRTLFPSLFLLCLFLVSGCQCTHKWTSADCTTAKRCCLCAATEGEPLGHAPDTAQQTLDPVSGTVITEQLCSICGVSLRREAAPLETLAQNGMFLFTPNEFLQRLSEFATERYPGFHFVLSGEQEPLFAKLYWDEAESLEALLSFYGADSVQLSAEDQERCTVWCVSLSMVGPSGSQEAAIPDAVALTFFHACDPALTEDTFQELQAMKLASLWNAVKTGEPFGYHEANGLLYEFLHTQNTSVMQDLPIESILVYASNWLAEQ